MIRFLAFAIMVPALLAQAPVFQSVHAAKDVTLTTDPESAFWRGIPGLTMDSDFFGNAVPNQKTEVRSRWTADNLYLLYICQYDELNLKPGPSATTETDRLWNWDVAEAFLGSDFTDINRYKEFQVSPRGEWVDLDIDRSPQKRGSGVKWDSGFEVKARIDRNAKVWYGAMKIPIRTIAAAPATAGTRIRAGLFRCAGTEQDRKYISWRQTGSKSFHVPERFGILELQGPVGR